MSDDLRRLILETDHVRAHADRINADASLQSALTDQSRFEHSIRIERQLTGQMKSVALEVACRQATILANLTDTRRAQ